MSSQVKNIQSAFGGTLVSDPYPLWKNDSSLWIKLLSETVNKSIGLYGELMKIRAIGATLVPSEKFGYIIKPMFIAQNKRGFPSEEVWNKEKQNLLPYTEMLKELLKQL